MAGVGGKYKAYPEYKDSGIEWLGVIPSGWISCPLKRYCGVTDGSHHSPRTENEGRPYISVTDVGANSIDFENCKKISEADFQRLVHEGCKPAVGDVLLTKDGTIGRAALVKEPYPDFVILSSLGLLTPSSKLLDTYLYYYLISGVNIDQMNSLIHGSALRRMTINKIDDLQLVLPSVEEQQAIAIFLDHETAKIDTLIEEQKTLIRLLQEKRQAVISHAVTKGLNPDAPMKNSGVEWLGEVPEHWSDTEIRYITHQIGGGTPGKDRLDFWNGNIPWVSPKDMKVDYLSDAQDKITDQAIQESSTKLIPVGSVLIVVRGMILVHSVSVALTQELVTVNQDMKALVPGKGVDGEFLLFFMKGLKGFILDLVEESAHGTKCLRTEVFERIKITIPALDEQIEIIKKLKGKLRVIDSLIDDAKQGVELFKERRTAQISAAVTGKIDVRDWQPLAHPQ